MQDDGQCLITKKACYRNNDVTALRSTSVVGMYTSTVCVCVCVLSSRVLCHMFLPISVNAACRANQEYLIEYDIDFCGKKVTIFKYKKVFFILKTVFFLFAIQKRVTLYNSTLARSKIRIDNNWCGIQ